jgi:CheY-like chemotaxis protein
MSASADAAFGTLKQWRPDLLVSDIGMPGEDGYALIRKVRALDPEEGGDTPAVALTAYARVEDRLKVLSAGFQMHIAKPIEPTELVAIVAGLSEVSGRHRAAAKG